MHLSRGRTRSIAGIRKRTVSMTSTMERNKSLAVERAASKHLEWERRELMNGFLARVETV